MVRFKLLIYLLVFSLVVLGGFLCWENRENRVLKSEVRDLSVRLAESQQKRDTFYIRDSVEVCKERVVEVDRTDYKKILADRELIKSLNLKVAQVEAENDLLKSVKDTVFMSETGDSLLKYADKWVDFEFFLPQKRLSYSVRDSLTTIVAREYKHRFLWWRWGTKGYSVYIVNHNPHSTVEYNRFIRVKQ